MVIQPTNNDGISNKRRDRHDILLEILETARGGKKKTHIMYKAKLSFSQINDYLDLLVNKEFMESNTIRRKRQSITFYDLTPKGYELLDALRAMYRLWNSDSYNNVLQR